MTTTHIAKLAKVVRARAKHFFGLPIKVKQRGNCLVLSVVGPKGEKASEEFSLEGENLRALVYSEEASHDFADGLINKFMFPVVALE